MRPDDERAGAVDSSSGRLRHATLAALLLPAAAAALEPPTTVWDLTRAAELVVVGRVELIEPRVSRGCFHDFCDLAFVEVLEVWKGAAPKSLGFTFPRLGRKLPRSGERVVAFLSPADNGWWSVFLAIPHVRWPASPLEEDELKTVVAKARLAQEELHQDRPTVEWAMVAARAPSTRAEGLTVLQSMALPAERQRELEKLVIARPSYDGELVIALQLLRETKSDALTAAAANAIQVLTTCRDVPIWLYLAVDELGRRLGEPLAWPELAHVPSPEDVRARWRALKQQHAIAAQAPPGFDRERWCAVGPSQHDLR